jgi:prefoldin subunit 1
MSMSNTIGSITNHAQLVQEIEVQAINAQRDINVVKSAVAGKQRDVRMLELTTTELKTLPKDTKVYEGVGKMYSLHLCHQVLMPSLNTRADGDRFINYPTPEVEKRLNEQTTEIKGDITNLNKKLHYLETTHKNSRENIDRIFKSGGRS